MPASPTVAVESIFREILYRTPQPGEFATYCTALRLGQLTEVALREELTSSDEAREVVAKVAAECRHVYQRILFREPTARELSRHIACFYKRFPTLDERLNTIHGGRLRQYLGIRPLSIEIDITTQCNIRCIMCYLSLPEHSKRKREDISIEEFDRVASQVFPLCNFVALSSSVEPLLHPQFGEILAITKGHGVEHITITTNGLLFNDRIIEQCISEGLDSMAISIDAATKPTYERLRRGGRFDRLIENIRRLGDAKRKAGTSHPWITLNMVLMRSNIGELPRLIELAKELGASGVCASHLTPYEGLDLDDESLSRDWEGCNEMLIQAKSLAANYRIAAWLPPLFDGPPGGDCGLTQLGTGRLNGDTSHEREAEPPEQSPVVDGRETRREVGKYGLRIEPGDTRTHCLFPWHYTIIGPYGEMQPCGWWYAEPMGNVRQESFEDIWNGERFRKLRAEHEAGTLNENCRTCPACGMGDVNNPDAFVSKPLMGSARP
jgi:radical SAM protein with 4Fe4S-binding SPASM domain